MKKVKNVPKLNRNYVREIEVQNNTVNFHAHIQGNYQVNDFISD